MLPADFNRVGREDYPISPGRMKMFFILSAKGKKKSKKKIDTVIFRYYYT